MSKTRIETVEITPEAFEKQVKLWLESLSEGLKIFRVTHLKKLKGHGGEFEIDAVRLKTQSTIKAKQKFAFYFCVFCDFPPPVFFYFSVAISEKAMS